ncbi:uncharacterized protein LOC144818744 isoform X1 [Lissotriton helveticus]
MSWQDSDKAPVTFHDVVACFSDDEWKLLHKWQKELYRNVMMEIHQALTSLGPLIASSIFSLRVQESDDVCPLDSPDPEKSNSINNLTNGADVNPEVLCRVSRQETLHLKSHKDTDGRAKSDRLSTGFPFSNTNVCLRKDDQSTTGLVTSDDCVDVEDSSTDLSSGHSIITSVVSFSSIKEEENYLMDAHELERRKNTTRSPGPNIVTRRMKEADSVKDAEVVTPCKASLRKIKENLPLNTDLETDSRTLLSSESNTKVRGIENAPCKEDFSNLKHYNLYPGTTDIEMQGTSNLNNYNVNQVDHPKFQPNVVQNWRLHTFEDCEETFSGTGNISCTQRTQTTDRPQVHTDYKNSFALKQCQHEHQRAHSEDKNSTAGPYICTQCGKTFSIKGSLLRHQKAHAGVRYACTECDKSFTQKGDLTIHQRTHAGKNPYTCTYCQKCFSSKCNLNQHKRKHIGQYAEYYPSMA